MGVASVLVATPVLAQDEAVVAAPREAPPAAPVSPAVPAQAASGAQTSTDVQTSSEVQQTTGAQAPAATAEGASATQAAPAEGAPNELESYELPVVHVVGKEPYNAKESALTRLPAPLLDTPQTVVVVPQKVMQEQRAVTVRDALRNVSGITMNGGEGGRQGDSFILRGFSAQNDVFRDGVRDLGWYTRDTFNVEGVEVFFGPSAVLFGRGSTGGAINLATKKPNATNSSAVTLSAGTAPTGRAELDVNRVLDEKVQVRINAAGQLSGVQGRDLTKQDRLGLAPSVAVQLTDHTRLDVDYLFQHEDGVPDYGQPYFNGQPVAVSLDVPRSAHYGIRGSDTELVDAHIATARLLQDLGTVGKLTNTFRIGKVDRFARPTAPRGLLTPEGGQATIGRQRFETATDNGYVFDQLDLRFVFSTAIVEHSLNVGLEASGERRDQQRYNLRDASNANPVADLYSPNPSPDISGYLQVTPTASKTEQSTVGVYIADQLKITKYLELLGSARFDWFQTGYTTYGVDDAAVGKSLWKTDRMFNWRAGAVVHPVEGVSVYGSYGTSSNPSAELGTLSDGTKTLVPERNNNLEVGAKAELFRGRLGLGLAAFRIEKENGRLANPDPTEPSQVMEGVQRVQGLNVGVTGAILPDWKVFANYTFMDSEIVKHTNNEVGNFIKGQSIPLTPEHSASLWTTVALTSRLSLGGGATMQSETIVNNPANASEVQNSLPAYVRLDGYVSYAFNAFDLQLNLNNLTNALYYDQGYSGHAIPAAERSAMLTARFDF